MPHYAARGSQTAANLSILINLCAFYSLSATTLAYRIHDYERQNQTELRASADFEAYDPGFVGRRNNASDPRRVRVNPGSPLTVTQPNIYDGVRPRQRCPGMVQASQDELAAMGDASFLSFLGHGQG